MKSEDKVTKSLEFPKVAFEKAWRELELTELTFKLEFVNGTKYKASLEGIEELELETKEAWSVTHLIV